MGVIANPKTNEINIRFAAPFLIESKIKVKIIAIDNATSPVFSTMANKAEKRMMNAIKINVYS